MSAGALKSYYIFPGMKKALCMLRKIGDLSANSGRPCGSVCTSRKCGLR